MHPLFNSLPCECGAHKTPNSNCHADWCQLSPNRPKPSREFGVGSACNCRAGYDTFIGLPFTHEANCAHYPKTD